MRISRIVWSAEIIDKLARKHQVQPSEVHEVLAGSPHVRFVEKGHRADEDVYTALGQTERDGI